ncbi:MAG: hypothetical protein MI725_15315 [Pirellulales bacterium]|nr:hypothetical protein [Pirellulales bacterium]
MNTSSSNDDSKRLEQIVAYLDGELSAEESAQVEQQLASDEHYRQQLQGIDQAWAALDQLPVATVDDKFSKTTMELVVQDARRDVEQRTMALPVRRRKRNLATALMVGTCALLGVLVFRVVWNNPNRQLLADLPVIQYIDLYTQFEDGVFGQALDRELDQTAWIPEMEAATLEQQVEQFQRVSHADTREDWLHERTAEEKAALRAKYNRFQGLSAEQRQRLRELHRQVASPDNAHLLVLLQFHQWLKGVPPNEQYELRQASTPQDRARMVAHMLDSQRRAVAFDLSDEELRKLIASFFQQAMEVLRKRGGSMSDQQKREFRNAQPHQRLGMIHQLMRASDLQNLQRELFQTLPEAARQQLQELPPREQEKQIKDWLFQARMLLRPQGKRGEVSEEQLEEFFAEELSAAQQEKLLALPREQMLEQLKQMYRGVSRRSDWPDRWREGSRPEHHRGAPRAGERRRREGGPPGPRAREGRDDLRGFGPPFDERPVQRPRRGPHEGRPDPPPADPP